MRKTNPQITVMWNTDLDGHRLDLVVDRRTGLGGLRLEDRWEGKVVLRLVGMEEHRSGGMVERR